MSRKIFEVIKPQIFPIIEVINIEGIDDPTSLQDILNFIYKRFTYAEDPNGFDYNEDIDRFIDILLLLGVMTRNGLGICGKGSDE